MLIDIKVHLNHFMDPKTSQESIDLFSDVFGDSGLSQIGLQAQNERIKGDEEYKSKLMSAIRDVCPKFSNKAFKKIFSDSLMMNHGVGGGKDFCLYDYSSFMNVIRGKHKNYNCNSVLNEY